MIMIKTNDRFDKLTNLDISVHYRNKEYWFVKSDFLAAFTYWVIKQSPYDVPDITKAINAFDNYISTKFIDKLPVKFSYEEVQNIINENVFESIPEIEILNHKRNELLGKQVNQYMDTKNPDDDFIDLGALARNIFYMLLREYITQG